MTPFLYYQFQYCTTAEYTCISTGAFRKKYVSEEALHSLNHPGTDAFHQQFRRLKIKASEKLFWHWS